MLHMGLRAMCGRTLKLAAHDGCYLIRTVCTVVLKSLHTPSQKCIFSCFQSEQLEKGQSVIGIHTLDVTKYM